MTTLIERRSFLSLMACVPLVVDSGTRAFAAVAGPSVRRISATPTREVEVTRWSALGKRVGSIAFSPGFGSSPRFYPDFVQAWTDAGYDVIAPLHVDSREYPNPGAFAGIAGWAARIEDMRAVSSLIDGPYVAAGHSFGALNALVLGGAGAIVPPCVTAPLRDKRALCVIAFSPPPPIASLIPEAGYAMLATPALVQTGTRDVLPSATTDPESWRGHFTAFAKSPMTGNHHGLILEGVDHYFGGLICDPTHKGPDQRIALKLATQASLAFLGRYARAGSTSASLIGPAFPRSPLARFYQQ
jgi:hypothetical protein